MKGIHDGTDIGIEEECALTDTVTKLCDLIPNDIQKAIDICEKIIMQPRAPKMPYEQEDDPYVELKDALETINTAIEKVLYPAAEEVGIIVDTEPDEFKLEENVNGFICDVLKLHGIGCSGRRV